MIKEKFKGYLEKYHSFPVQVRASFWFLICSFLQRGISTLTTPIFTRLLSTAEYGQFNVFNSWLSILCVFITLNCLNIRYKIIYICTRLNFPKIKKMDRKVFLHFLQKGEPDWKRRPSPAKKKAAPRPLNKFSIHWINEKYTSYSSRKDWSKLFSRW